jgi:hypothetical protein
MLSNNITFEVRICPHCVKPFKSYYSQNRLKCNRPACKQMRGIEPPSIEERFWSKVDKSAGPDACWIWTAAKYSNGYGHFVIDKKNCLAHRISYELTHGKDSIPEGMAMLHSCPDKPTGHQRY